VIGRFVGVCVGGTLALLADFEGLACFAGLGGVGVGGTLALLAYAVIC